MATKAIPMPATAKKTEQDLTKPAAIVHLGEPTLFRFVPNNLTMQPSLAQDSDDPGQTLRNWDDLFVALVVTAAP